MSTSFVENSIKLYPDCHRGNRMSPAEATSGPPSFPLTSLNHIRYKTWTLRDITTGRPSWRRLTRLNGHMWWVIWNQVRGGEISSRDHPVLCPRLSTFVSAVWHEGLWDGLARWGCIITAAMSFRPQHPGVLCAAILVLVSPVCQSLVLWREHQH